MRIPARVDDGPAVAGPERAREIAPELQGCLRGAVGAAWCDNYQWDKQMGLFTVTA